MDSKQFICEIVPIVHQPTEHSDVLSPAMAFEIQKCNTEPVNLQCHICHESLVSEFIDLFV